MTNELKEMNWTPISQKPQFEKDRILMYITGVDDKDGSRFVVEV